MAIAPITPAEAKAQHVERVPDYVILAVNQLIVEYYQDNYDFTIPQAEIVDLALKTGIESGELEEGTGADYLFENGYLDFEELYAKNGWSVMHNKPDLGENWKPYFSFRKKSDE